MQTNDSYSRDIEGDMKKDGDDNASSDEVDDQPYIHYIRYSSNAT